MNPQHQREHLARQIEEARLSLSRLLDCFEEVGPGRYALDVEYDDGDGLVTVGGFMQPSVNALIEEAFAALAELEDDDEA